MRWLVLLALAVSCGGCATIARGTGEQVAFDTVPTGAEVRVTIASLAAANPENPPDGPPPATMGCVTPCVLQVKRADKMAVTITKPGYELESFALNPQVSGEGAGTTILGNALIGGVIGAGVDAVSGAMLDHCPNPVRVMLRPLPVPPSTRRGREPVRPTVPPAFSFDPVEACKEQTAAKYKVHDQAQKSPEI